MSRYWRGKGGWGKIKNKRVLDPYLVDEEDTALGTTHSVQRVIARAAHVSVDEVARSGILEFICWQNIKLAEHDCEALGASGLIIKKSRRGGEMEISKK